MPPLRADDVNARLVELPGWRLEGDAIERPYEFEDFAESIAFINRIAEVAEEMSHHPDLAVSWNLVTVSLTTHSQGGLTDSDFELARRIEGLS